MHKKYAKDGLVAMAVALDDVKSKGIKERLVKFLESKGAAFPNFQLDEKPEFWQEKLGIDGPPAVFVFDRQGQYKKFSEDFSYADVEKYAVPLLKAK